MCELNLDDFLKWAKDQDEFGPAVVQRRFKLGYFAATQFLEQVAQRGHIKTTDLPYRYRINVPLPK